MNGSNDNPVATQFISAYRKLLYQSDIQISKYSNVASQCMPNILTISSKSKSPAEEQDSLVQTAEQEETEWYEVLELESLENCDSLIDKHDSGISFVANILEQRLLKGPIYCNFCREVLQRNKKVNDNMCVSLENGKPCLSSYVLCKLTDTALKTLMNTGSNFKQKIYCYVMNQIDFDNIFPDFLDPEHDIDHKHFLIKFFIDEYTHKKCAYVAKQKSIALQKRYVRNSLRKLCHFLHQ